MTTVWPQLRPGQGGSRPGSTAFSSAHAVTFAGLRRRGFAFRTDTSYRSVSEPVTTPWQPLSSGRLTSPEMRTVVPMACDSATTPPASSGPEAPASGSGAAALPTMPPSTHCLQRAASPFFSWLAEKPPRGTSAQHCTHATMPVRVLLTEETDDPVIPPLVVVIR